MIRRAPRSNVTYTLFPDATLVRSDVLRGNGFGVGDAGVEVDQCFLRLSVVIQLESEIAEWAGLVIVRLRVDPRREFGRGPRKLKRAGLRSEERRVGKEGVGTCR